MTNPRPQGLVVFDLDGTLLRGPTVCEILAGPLGRTQRMQELERFKTREELRAAREEMAGWYRVASVSTLLASLEGARFAAGAATGLSLLRAHGVAIGIASITWSFAVEHFARGFGVKDWLGTELRDSGEIAHVWPEHKARWVQELAQRLGVPAERTAAVGDSAGDDAMLGAVGVPIFVGAELPAPRPGWLHRPAESIDWVAKHLLQVWRLPPEPTA
jgi:phosphoserine phosphatase